RPARVSGRPALAAFAGTNVTAFSLSLLARWNSAPVLGTLLAPRLWCVTMAQPRQTVKRFGRLRPPPERGMGQRERPALSPAGRRPPCSHRQDQRAAGA